METSQDLLQKVKQEVITCCEESRISVKKEGTEECKECIHAPISLFPSPFEKKAFEKIESVQVGMNQL